MLLLPFIFFLGVTVHGIPIPGEKLTKDPNCECQWRYLDHYEALGCRPVYEENPDDGKPECKCPKRFDCSETDEMSADNKGCVYKKQVYPVGTEIPTTNPCMRCSCITDYITQNATINCIASECLGWATHPPGCYHVYTENACCPTSVECPDKENETSSKVPICEYKGNMYYEGQKIEPDEMPCLTCLCNSNWTGINSASCKPIDCMLERKSELLRQGCMPIYHEDTCCPIEFHCPDKDFEERQKVMKQGDEDEQDYEDDEESTIKSTGDKDEQDYEDDEESTISSTGDKDEMCLFEGRYYPVGHELNFVEPSICATCICKTPPVFTCLQRGICRAGKGGDSPHNNYEVMDYTKVILNIEDINETENNPHGFEFFNMSEFQPFPSFTSEDDEAENNPHGIEVVDMREFRPFSSLKSEDDEVCLYGKQRYPVDAEVLTTNPCEQCFCRKGIYDPAAEIECTYVECPFIYPVPKECQKVYIENKCSPTSVECHNETQNTDQQLTKDRHCDCDWKYLQHYEAKGCHPVYDEKPANEKQCTCPLRFDCSQPDVMYANETACVYKKQYYPVGTDIPITNRCRPCSCRKNDFEQTARIDCAVYDCPTIHLPEGCHHVYTEVECCPSSVECPGKEKGTSSKVPICEYKGKMYYEGQHIYPDEGPCLTCICNSNWNGINSTSCTPRECLFELNSRELMQGCIPIYYENDCCPMEYHCPDRDVELKASKESSLNSKGDTDDMCYFEGEYYPIGHVLDYNHTTNCVTCTCEMPPDFTCIHSSCSFPPDADNSNCRTVNIKNECCPKRICREKNGILYDPYECISDEKKKCDHGLLPKDYPATTEELRTVCDNFADYSRCMIHVHESCEYSEESLKEVVDGIESINSFCEEDDPIYKIISSNLDCIAPVARKLEDTCNSFQFSEENRLIRERHEDEITANFTRKEVLECLKPFWYVNCRSITLGLHCGLEVQKAVNNIMMEINDRYKKCSNEILEELQPLLETYETIIKSEQKLKEAFSKRK